MSVEVSLRVVPPDAPRYLKDISGRKICLTKFTDDELEKIAAAFAVSLIEMKQRIDNESRYW